MSKKLTQRKGWDIRFWLPHLARSPSFTSFFLFNKEKDERIKTLDGGVKARHLKML